MLSVAVSILVRGFCSLHSIVGNPLLYSSMNTSTLVLLIPHHDHRNTDSVSRTLFFTTFAAVFIFLFGLAAYYIIKWFNQKDVPGIHVPLKEGLADQMGIGSADDSKKGTTSNGDSNARTNGTAQKQMNGGRGEHEKTPEKAAHEKKKTQHRDGSQQQQQQHHKKTADRDDNEDQDGDKENRPPKLDKPSGKGKGADAVTGDAREKVNGLTG